MILRILFAVLLGVLTTWLLNYLQVLTHSINVLIGCVVALLVYFGKGL